MTDEHLARAHGTDTQRTLDEIAKAGRSRHGVRHCDLRDQEPVDLDHGIVAFFTSLRWLIAIVFVCVVIVGLLEWGNA